VEIYGNVCKVLELSSGIQVGKKKKKTIMKNNKKIIYS